MSEPKLEKLILLLSSDQTGEVAAAAAAIGRFLPTIGLDWHEFARRCSQLEKLGTSKPTSSRETFHAEYNNVMYMTQKERDWLSELIGKVQRMKPNERDFIEQQYDRQSLYGNKTLITSKQRNWLQSIADRFL